MKITVKFFSSLMEYLPDNIDGNSMELEVGEGISANEILMRYKIPQAEVQTMMKNGVFLPEEQRDEQLGDGDTITVWPSIQGG